MVIIDGPVGILTGSSCRSSRRRGIAGLLRCACDALAVSPAFSGTWSVL
jgi:hypothetical protein